MPMAFVASVNRTDERVQVFSRSKFDIIVRGRNILNLNY